jgi:hypothetical protein
LPQLLLLLLLLPLLLLRLCLGLRRGRVLVEEGGGRLDFPLDPDAQILLRERWW